MPFEKPRNPSLNDFSTGISRQMADSFLYRYITSHYSWSQLAEAGFPKERIIDIIKIQQASHQADQQPREPPKPAITRPEGRLTRRDILPLEKGRLQEKRKYTKHLLRCVYRRPAEDDEQLVDATEPVMGKIEFELLIPDDTGIRTRAEKMEYAGRLFEAFKQELEGLCYMEVEGGMDVKLLEPYLLKVRLQPGIRVRCDARFFPDLEYLLRQMVRHKLYEHQQEHKRISTAESTEVDDAGNAAAVKFAALAAELELSPHLDKYGRWLIVDIEKSLARVREAKANGTYQPPSFISATKFL